MKRLGLLLSILFHVNVFSQSESDEKTYTQKEFKKKLESKVKEKLKKLHPDNLVSFSKELLDKEKKLEKIEQEIEKKKEQLKMNTQDFRRKLKKFSERQESFISCIDQRDVDKEKRVLHMVKVVEGMRAKSAANVLSVQDIEITVKILDKLDAERVSKIFNSMDKEISARLQKQYMTMKK